MVEAMVEYSMAEYNMVDYNIVVGAFPEVVMPMTCLFGRLNEQAAKLKATGTEPGRVNIFPTGPKYSNTEHIWFLY